MTSGGLRAVCLFLALLLLTPGATATAQRLGVPHQEVDAQERANQIGGGLYGLVLDQAKRLLGHRATDIGIDACGTSESFAWLACVESIVKEPPASNYAVNTAHSIAGESQQSAAGSLKEAKTFIAELIAWSEGTGALVDGPTPPDPSMETTPPDQDHVLRSLKNLRTSLEATVASSPETAHEEARGLISFIVDLVASAKAAAPAAPGTDLGPEPSTPNVSPDASPVSKFHITYARVPDLTPHPEVPPLSADQANAIVADSATQAQESAPPTPSMPTTPDTPAPPALRSWLDQMASSTVEVDPPTQEQILAGLDGRPEDLAQRLARDQHAVNAEAGRYDSDLDARSQSTLDVTRDATDAGRNQVRAAACQYVQDNEVWCGEVDPGSVDDLLGPSRVDADTAPGSTTREAMVVPSTRASGHAATSPAAGPDLDADGSPPEEADVRPAPVSPDSTAADPVGATGRLSEWTTAALVAAAAATAALLLLAPLAALFSRIRKERLLGHPRRKEILDLVTAAPGLHQDDLRQRLDCSSSVIRHHVDKLVSGGLVVRRRVAGRVCHFLTGSTDVPKMDVHGLVACSERITAYLSFLRTRPGATATEVAKACGIAKATASYYLKKLTEAGLVYAEPDGPRVRLRVSGAGMQALDATAATTVSATAATA